MVVDGIEAVPAITLKTVVTNNHYLEKILEMSLRNAYLIVIFKQLKPCLKW